MKKSILFPIFCMLLSCGSPSLTEEQNVPSPDNAFALLKDNFIEDLWKLYPGWASSQGYHKYDSLLTINDETFRSKEAEFTKNWLTKLGEYKPEKLSPGDRTDYYLIKNQLESSTFYNSEFKSFEWDPSSYNVGSAFGEIINGSYASIEERMKSLLEKLKNVPLYYENAKRQIKNPTVEHTDLAINQNRGSLSLFNQGLLDSCDKAHFTNQQKAEFETRMKAAVSAIEGYANWLEKDIKPKLASSGKSFRIGKELFEKKFSFEIQSKFKAEEIFKKALQHKKELHGEMYKITSRLWSKYFVKEKMPTDSLLAIRLLIDKLSLKHSKPENFQQDIEKQIPQLAQFVNEKNLLFLDPSKPLEVRKEPAYMAGVAGASISAPGPYDKDAKTYYNVGSLANYTKDQAESYLREYNDYILQILNIHEAIPGHYAQLVYSNQSPSLVKSILGNGAMIEGWAVYTERMMIENGYGNNEPEMWLMYYKWNLRATCNTLLDYSIHCLNMSEKDALDLIMKQAFQQEAEAKGKWRRATLTQVQLSSYFTGYTEIYEFRQHQKEVLGTSFSLKAFHEKFLSYGSAPVKFIQELMEEKESN